MRLSIKPITGSGSSMHKYRDICHMTINLRLSLKSPETCHGLPCCCGGMEQCCLEVWGKVPGKVWWINQDLIIRTGKGWWLVILGFSSSFGFHGQLHGESCDDRLYTSLYLCTHTFYMEFNCQVTDRPLHPPSAHPLTADPMEDRSYLTQVTTDGDCNVDDDNDDSWPIYNL